MSPRQGPARPIKKIKLKVILEGDEPSLALAARALSGSRLEGRKLVMRLQTSEVSEAIKQIERVGKAVKSPKDFK